jgi:hypothetical protein
MSEAYKAYQLFQSLRLHFTTEAYDYFKYRGTIPVTLLKFESRKDKGFYYRLAKLPNLEQLIISNMIHNDVAWPGDLLDDSEAPKRANEYRKYLQSLTYMFTQDLGRLGNDYMQLARPIDGQLPELIVAMRQRRISFLTVSVLDDMFDHCQWWNSKITDPIIWPTISLKLRKHRPFIRQHYQVDKIRRIVRDKYFANPMADTYNTQTQTHGVPQ